MSSHRTLESEITRVARVISLIGLAGLLMLAGITVGEVLIRWLIKFPIRGVFDLSQLVIIIVIASCLPLVSAERRHVTVRLIGTMGGRRANALLEAFGALITTLIFGLMTWELWVYADELSAANESTWLTHWPVAPWWRVTTVMIALCCAIQFVLFFISLRSVFTARRDERIKPEANSKESKKNIHE